MTERPSQIPDRVRFDRLLQEMTARLVGAKGLEIDAAMDDCLSRLGEHFGVDGVGFGGMSESGEIVPSTLFRGQVAPSDATSVSPPPGPDMVARIRREGSLVFSRPEDLDDLPQFQEHSRHAGVSASVLWVHRDLGSHFEGLSLTSPNPKTWPEDIVERLGSAGEVLYNALYRRRAEVEVERLRSFERLAAGVASSFVHLPPERVDEEIDNALGRICECADADLGIFLQWKDPEMSTLRVSHEWNMDSIDGPYFRAAVLSDEYPWLATRLREASPLLIANLDDLPPEAEKVRATCERIGIQSSVWAPFVAAYGLMGYVALSTINRPGSWLEAMVPQLGLVGNVFASAIQRQRTDIELRQAYDQIRRLKDQLETENITLREEIKTTFEDDEIVGTHHAFRTVLHQSEQVGPTDSTVLILGETGTGKGLIARSIHQKSSRSSRPMVTVNCAALPASLIESELFGHEKGAFTGAVERKIGRFELAEGGTIFLDEIGDLPLELQAKLLRVLQDHEFERLGSSKTLTVDTRVLAATSRDLDTLIEQGLFRADLYYRLGVFPIRMPPLRERRSDIPLLVWFYITKLQGRLGKTFETVSTSVMDAMTSYEWPGNVRELRNVVERAMIVSPGPRFELAGTLPRRRTEKNDSTQTDERPGANLEDVERTHIVRVLEECGWRVSGKAGAAERLGLKRSTLQSRMKKLGIRRPAS